MLIDGLVHVILSLGHVPGCGVGWHHIVGKHLETGTTEAKQKWKKFSYLEKLLFERGQQLTGNSVIGCRSGDELNLDKTTVFVQEIKETSNRKEALVHEQVRRLTKVSSGFRLVLPA